MVEGTGRLGDKGPGGWGEEWREIDTEEQPMADRKLTPKSRGMALAKKTPTQQLNQPQDGRLPSAEALRGGGGVEPGGGPTPHEGESRESPSPMVGGEARGGSEDGRGGPLATSTPTNKSTGKTQVCLVG